MVGKPSGGLRTTPLTSLVPRQVMLESCAVVTASGGDKLAEKKSKKRQKGELEEKRTSPVARAALLRTIAAFLERGGFTRTLAALRSEAQFEIGDGSKTSVVDLEEIIYNYLESSNFSKDAVVGTITGPEEQDAQNKAPRKEEGIHDHSEEPISKKKKKKVHGGDDDVKTDSEKSARENGVAECHWESKDQKRKKSKMPSKETIKSVGHENLLRMVEEKSENLIPLSKNASGLLDESNIRSKDEKKKKTKLAIDSPSVVVNQDGLKTSQEEKGKSKESDRKTDSQMPTIATENVISGNPMGEDNSKSKDKKKRKHNLIVESSSGYGVEVQNRSKVDGGKKGKSVSHVIEEDAKGSNPNIENIPSSPNTVNIDKKAKKRKRSATEETEVHLDNDATVQESKQDLKGGKNKEETSKLDDSLLNSELHTYVKKKKSEKSEDNSKKSANAPANKESQDLKDANGTPATINGNLGKSEREGNGLLKSKRAQLRHSAEPKTVNAFQRVKIDEVKFADERLQDNSYWAKDGAESGYGAKAQEILCQVRGRGFRHEKTKKKRGSYRGGQIDFQSHSVKFKYSDDEE